MARLLIGLMSGTSVDAIDAALVRIEGRGPRYRATVVGHTETAWPRDVRRRLLAIMAPAATTTQELCQMNVLVAREFARAVEAVLKKTGVRRDDIAALASHGQTVCHLPPVQRRHSKIKDPSSHVPSTLQLGDVSVLAAITGIRTVGNFRPADMAAGGQGAPLVPWADAALLSHPRLARCVQNIGGIANVTFIPPGPPASSLVAFDTGPGNMLLDAVVSLHTRGRRHFDKGGRLARAGTLDDALFARLRAHPYFSRRPPKSTGREEFGADWARRLLRPIGNRKPRIENLLYTLTRLTAWSIADAYRRFLPRLPDEVILCGGGADNPVLVRMLGEELGPAVRLSRIDDFGIPNKSKEAASFALLAAATLDGIPSNVPSVTGASRPMVLGAVAHARPRPN